MRDIVQVDFIMALGPTVTHGPSEELSTVAAVLTYRRRDPFAVTVAMEEESGNSTEWAVSRELLSKGVCAELPEGIGDFMLYACQPHGVHIELSSPEGSCTLHAPRKPVVDFLRATYRLVPDGQETAGVDMDAAIRQLIGE